mmetsp:Transcript_47216/g.117851  ORF Transcript_47216/g.117851 Transcript_47216/m.117851 type:complete len:299 (-) Transcript_47216:102-998(-)
MPTTSADLDSGMGDLRDQYISKIPSSAFLTLAPDLLKEGSVYVAQLSTVDGGRDAFITEARSLVIENDEATTHVDVLQNLEDPSQWMVIEAYKRGGGPARDAQGKLSGFLKRTEKLMSVPEDMSELEMMVESPDLAEKRDLTTVYLEQVQCKPGIGMDDKLIEATRTLSRAVGGHTTAPDTPSTTTTTSPAPTAPLLVAGTEVRHTDGRGALVHRLGGLGLLGCLGGAVLPPAPVEGAVVGDAALRHVLVDAFGHSTGTALGRLPHAVVLGGLAGAEVSSLAVVPGCRLVDGFGLWER